VKNRGQWSVAGGKQNAAFTRLVPTRREAPTGALESCHQRELVEAKQSKMPLKAPEGNAVRNFHTANPSALYALFCFALASRMIGMVAQGLSLKFGL